MSAGPRSPGQVEQRHCEYSGSHQNVAERRELSPGCRTDGPPTRSRQGGRRLPRGQAWFSPEHGEGVPGPQPEAWSPVCGERNGLPRTGLGGCVAPALPACGAVSHPRVTRESPGATAMCFQGRRICVWGKPVAGVDPGFRVHGAPRGSLWGSLWTMRARHPVAGNGISGKARNPTPGAGGGDRGGDW